MSDYDNKPRWFHPTPGWLVLGSIAATGVFYLSERFRWFAINYCNGWTVLIAMTVLGLVLVALLFWWLAALASRRRFQFSIRTLMVLVIAVALPCSWLACEMKRARRQREAADTIYTFGGHIVFEDQSVLYKRGNEITTIPWNPPVFLAKNLPQMEPWNTSPWLRRLLGDDFFMIVVAVNQSYQKVTDDGLNYLPKLSELKALNLDKTQVTDVGLTNLRGLTALQSLSLNGTRITDAGLKNVEELKTLKELSLNKTQITDAGLESLKGLKSLRNLSLEDTKVTPDGAWKLQQFLPDCRIMSTKGEIDGK
jgi:hypothetical protein